MIAALKIFLCYAVLSPFAALVGFPWTWITGDITFLYRSAMWIAATGIRWARIRVCAAGLENVPRNCPCIFMANHISNLDPPVFLPLIPGRTAVFVKKSLMRIPFIGMAMRMGGFVAVDRSGTREAARESIGQASRVLASGVHITSFPEGTRSRTGQLLPFKKGPFYLAQQTGAPIIPVSIYGTETMMRKGSLQVTPGDAHVHFHAPIFARDYATREALMTAVRAAIASSLPEWMRG
ncbi:MAG: lysophospholipid acyltransferase family protein [Acidobacteriaceae bacterium]